MAGEDTRLQLRRAANQLIINGHHGAWDYEMSMFQQAMDDLVEHFKALTPKNKR